MDFVVELIPKIQHLLMQNFYVTYCINLIRQLATDLHMFETVIFHEIHEKKMPTNINET